MDFVQGVRKQVITKSSVHSWIREKNKNGHDMGLIMHAARMLATSSKCVITPWFGRKNQELWAEKGLKTAWYCCGKQRLSAIILTPYQNDFRKSRFFSKKNSVECWIYILILKNHYMLRALPQPTSVLEKRDTVALPIILTFEVQVCEALHS